MRNITKRLTAKFDFYQLNEQAGFRKSYGTNDHLHTVKMLTERCIEYNKPLVLVFVDQEKAFDTVDHNSMLQALAVCRIDHRYTNFIEHVYKKANGEKLSHLCFADDLVLIADRLDEAKEMLKELQLESKKLG